MHLRIGMVGPLSGDYAAYGTQVLSGSIQAITDINESGGVHGVQLEIIPFDDQCNADIAVRQANDLVKQHKLHAIVGHVCSAATLATAPIYAKANILVITPSATNPHITQHSISTLFRISGNDIHQAEVAANFLHTKLKSKQVAILHDQDLYSKALADKVSELLAEYGTPPILYHATSRGTRNFSALIKKLKLLSADAVYFAGMYPEVAALASSMHTLELQIPLLAGDGCAVPQLHTATSIPKIAHEILFTFGVNPATLVATRKISSRMHEQKLDASGYALYAYAAVQIIAAALRESNSTDGKVLSAWLHNHEVETILGKKSWDTNGDSNQNDFAVYAWQPDGSMHKF